MPKTLLFATGFINSRDDIDKYVRYYNYYKNKKNELGYDKLVIIDDGSLSYWIESLADKLGFDMTVFYADSLPETFPDGLNWITLRPHLGRPEWLVTAGWFRSFTFSYYIAQQLGFTKLIHIESDAFILSERAFDKLRNTNTDWLVFWCSCYKFPETAIQVINDINLLKPFFEAREKCWYGAKDNDRNIAEFVFPFTEIFKDFIGDRYGEDPINDIPDNADYACQIAKNHFKPVPGIVVKDKIKEIQDLLA